MNAILDTESSSPLSFQEILKQLEARDPQELLAIIKRATELLEAQLPTSNKGVFQKTSLTTVYQLVDILDDNVYDIIARKMNEQCSSYFTCEQIQKDSWLRPKIVRSTLKSSPDITRPFVYYCYDFSRTHTTLIWTPENLFNFIIKIFQNIQNNKITLSNVKKYIRILDNIWTEEYPRKLYIYPQLTDKELDKLDFQKLTTMNKDQKREFKEKLDKIENN